MREHCYAELQVSQAVEVDLMRPHRRRPMLRYALVLCAVVSQSATSHAGLHILRPSTRPFFFSFTLGGAISIEDYVSQFKIAQEAGWHINGSATGFAVGLVLQQSFGDSLTSFQIGPKAWYTIQVLSNVGFYIVPFIHLGYSHASFSADTRVGPFSNSENFFNWQFGAEGRLVIADRFFALVRPVTFDFFHGDNFGLRYDFLVGGGVTF